MKAMDISTGEARATWVATRLATAKCVYHELPNTNYTVCVITFADGWSQLGSSVCVDRADYNPKIGRKIARENALADAETHYWRTVGYVYSQGAMEL